MKEWSMRVKKSFLAIFIVDAWKLYIGGKPDRRKMELNQFYSKLEDGSISNKCRRTFITT